TSAQACITVQRGVFGNVADAQIANTLPPKNFGASLNMNTGLVGSAQRQTLISYDLSAIPAGPATNVTAASFDLAEALAPTGPGTIEVHRITAPWNEATVTWQSFGGAFDPTVEASFGNGAPYPNVNIPSLVTGWVQGAFPNDGMLLEEHDGN